MTKLASNLSHLSHLYEDPKTGLGAAGGLYAAAKKAGLKVTMNQVHAFLAENSVAQQFQPVAAHFFPIVRGRKPFARCQMDLLDVSNEQPRLNGGTKFLLCFIDTLSRFALAVPMRSKSQEDSLRAFESIVESVKKMGYRIVTVDSDQESAFCGADFQAYAKRNQIRVHFIPVSDQHGTAFVERFNRTMRILLEKLKVSQGSNVYLPFLPDLLTNYNTRVHQVIGMSPKEALSKGQMTKGDERDIAKRVVLAEGERLNVQMIKVGDRVRVELRKNKLIDKGSAPRFSVSRHTVEREDGGLYYASGRVEPYRANELLLSTVEDGKQEWKEVRAAEQVAARRELRIDRRIAKEGIERHVEPTVKQAVKQPVEQALPRRSTRVVKPVHAEIDKRYGAILR